MRAVAPVALAVSFLVAPACRAAKPGEASAVVPELRLEGVTFRVYRGETLRALGEARTASLRRDSTQVQAQELVTTLPGATDPVRITAPAAEGVLEDRVFSASGGIELARGGDVARTERARFEPVGPAGRVTGDAPVVVEGPGYRLEGPGFTLDPATGDIAIRGGVKVVAGGAR